MRVQAEWSVGSGSQRRGLRPRPAGSLLDRPAELTVQITRRGRRPLITVSGALDVSGAALLSAMLEHVGEAQGPPAEVDLTDVDYADSHGLAPVLDGRATISGASPQVRRILDILQEPCPQPV
ncbi:STAS domain-containing protein [Geodermatophilus obscurus]|uniref:STAS domain-containing protein n=1 Tax=Geodermatophilus obscurus TaxID=1861 RepID=UPI00116049B3|nr:STAS domain-containing protein [Geodermatophilus obscurus]